MTTILASQIELLDRQVAADARGGPADARAVQEMIGVDVALFALLKAGVDDWNAVLPPGDEAYMERADEARRFEKAYRDLGRAFDATAKLIDAVRRTGRALPRAGEFADAHDELRGILAHSVDKVLRAIEQSRTGKGRPIEEVMDEIRRRARA